MKALYSGLKHYSFILISLVLLIAPYLSFINQVQAGSFTSSKMTISDSRSAVSAVTYNFAFSAPTTATIKQLTVEFCTTPSGSCTTPPGMVTTSAIRSFDNIAGTGRTDNFSSNGVLTSVISATSPQSNQNLQVTYTTITNPTTDNTSFYSRITTYSDTGSTVIDSTRVAAAVLTSSSITVSASIDSTFTFTVAGVTSGANVNGATSNVSTTATTIPFGTLSPGAPNIAAHDLTVLTNATGGYIITVKSLSSPPLSDALNDIDEFSAPNSAPILWTTPAGTTANVNTGFFGYTTADATLGSGTANRFTSGGPKWSGTSLTASEIVYNSVAPVGGTETTRVGWQSEINNLQPFGTYTGTIILVATPTY